MRTSAETRRSVVGRTHPSRAARWTSVACAALLTLGLSACGEYSPVGDDTAGTPTLSPSEGGGGTTGGGSDPDPGQAAGGGGSGGSGNAGGEIPVVYTWGLPPTDTSVSSNDGPAYSALLQGACDDAAAFFEPTGPFLGNPYGFSSPRYVLLLAAGIAMCRGDEATARSLSASALDQWGTAGLDEPGYPRKPGASDPNELVTDRPAGFGEPECDLYRTLKSVLDQVAPDGLECAGGEGPTWRTRDYLATGGWTITVYDDPLTPDDESGIAPEGSVEESNTGQRSEAETQGPLVGGIGQERAAVPPADAPPGE